VRIRRFIQCYLTDLCDSLQLVFLFNFPTGASTGIVATCGGNIVCLIDCSTGQVMRRYQEQKEVCKQVHMLCTGVHMPPA
jgi:hypothetical protein